MNLLKYQSNTHYTYVYYKEISKTIPTMTSVSCYEVVCDTRIKIIVYVNRKMFNARRGSNRNMYRWITITKQYRNLNNL